MTIITDHNHLLKDVTQADINYIRVSQYKQDVNTDAQGTYSPYKRRINCSINFVKTSPYAEYHKEGFLNLLFKPTTRLRDLQRSSSAHPDWVGFTEIRDWAKQPDHSVALTSKGSFVGKKGNRRVPEPAYYTVLGLGYEDHDLTDPYVWLRIGNYQTYIEIFEVTKNKFFDHIGEHSEWH